MSFFLLKLKRKGSKRNRIEVEAKRTCSQLYKHEMTSTNNKYKEVKVADQFFGYSMQF